MMKLYFLEGSKHSKEAVNLIKRSNLEVELIDASERMFLTALHRELGITELPCLVGNNQMYMGLDEIKRYLKCPNQN